jgi:hypothetical protein
LQQLENGKAATVDQVAGAGEIIKNNKFILPLPVAYVLSGPQTPRTRLRCWGVRSGQIRLERRSSRP